MDTRELMKKVRAIEIRTRGMVSELFSGEYHSAFKGRGMEFSEVREYVAGDDVRTIDWNVTAREGRPFIKLFEEERELVVMLLVDVSASGEFGSVSTLKREMAAELAAVLAFSAQRTGDKVGMILFTDRKEVYVPPKSGTSHTLRIIRDLLAYKPEGKKTDLGKGLEFMLRVQPKRSIVFLLSDFIDPGNWQDAAKIASQKHDLVALQMLDPREQEIPDVGWIAMRDPETEDIVWVDSQDKGVRDSFKKHRLSEENTLRQFLAKNNIDRVKVDLTEEDQPYMRPLVEFFKRREMRR
ncbi:DUF58 domain-containing protein [bacterium]|nr:DUF58 domain-containing protein [bacterium]